MHKNLILFRNLVNLAAADCRFTDEELEFLADRAQRWGIGFTEFDAEIARVAKGQIRIDLPDSAAERTKLVQEMIRMMAADGVLADIEKRLCAAASAKMNFSSDQFNRILDSVLDD